MKKLNLIYNIIKNKIFKKYDCMLSTCSEEKSACQKIVNDIFVNELQRGGSFNFNESDILLVCKDTTTNEIIGCIQATSGDLLPKNNDNKHYYIDRIPDNLHHRIIVFQAFAIKPEYRSSIAYSLLFLFAHDYAMSQNYVAALCTCEPNLYSYYASIGFRPLSNIYTSIYSGYRITLYLIGADWRHLQEINSPLLHIGKKYAHQENPQLKKWNEEFVKELENEINFTTDIPHHEIAAFDNRLLNKISKKGKIEILKHSIKITGKYNDKIFTKDDGGKTLGFITRGMIKVIIGSRVIQELRENDIFGELAYISNKPRTATLQIAAEGTQIVLLSAHFFDHITNKEDQIQVLKNINELLADRLFNTNQIILHDDSG